MRIAAYALHFAALWSLYLASGRSHSLRRIARVTLAGLVCSVVLAVHVDRSNRWDYHAIQSAQFAWLALVAYAAGAPPRAAVALYGAFVLGAVAWYPSSAAPLYAFAQLVTVGVSVAVLAVSVFRSRVVLPGHRAAIVLVTGEGAMLVGPYAYAWAAGIPVNEAWSAALPIRCVEWASLVVVAWHTWRRSGGYSRRNGR